MIQRRMLIKNKMVARIIQSLKGDSSDISCILDVGCGDGHLLEVIRESYPLIQGEDYELPGCEEAAVAKGLSFPRRCRFHSQ